MDGHEEAPDPDEVSLEQYMELFETMDTGKIEYWGDRIRIGGEPFYGFVQRYLALRGVPGSDEPKRLTADQYELLHARYGDEIEYDQGEMLIGGQPFFEFAVRYLRMLGYEVRPA